jgi:RNA polymerase sigma-70 factor (ECF subfamily)
MQEAFDNTDGIHPAESRANRPGPGKLFVTTLWSVVLRAGSESEAESAAALERLCRQYWQPLYVFARRMGHSEHDAQDLTQGFLADLVAQRALARADPNRGRFRNFLLASFRHFLANRHREQLAGKRGGGATHDSLEELAETNALPESGDGLTPERQYERTWALAVLDRVLQRLRTEYVAAGREHLFEAVQPFLAAAGERHGYAQLGEQLGMAESTVGVTIHRMRRRYGDLLREEIAATVATPEEVDDELRHLLRVVSDVPAAS